MGTRIEAPTVPLPLTNVQISSQIWGNRIEAPTVQLSPYQMSKYPAQYRGPGHRHPQYNRHSTKCPNIRPNTGDQDTGTRSPPATVANVQISGQIQGTRIEAPTVQLSLYQMSKYPAQYRGPGSGTHSQPATVANVQISSPTQGPRIQAPTVHLLTVANLQI